MDILLTGILLAAVFYVGWNIGANDAANCEDAADQLEWVSVKSII